MGFFEKLVAGLGKTRDNIVSGMDSIFHGFSRIDDDFYEELEEVLIMGDLGVQATYDILDDLKAKVKEKHIKEPMECRELLIESIKEQMDIGETAYEFENCTSVVIILYDIWKDAYWGIRQTSGSNIAVGLMVSVMAMQYMGLREQIKNGDVIVHGVLTWDGGIYLLILVFFALILANLLVKSWMDKRGGSSE